MNKEANRDKKRYPNIDYFFTLQTPAIVGDHSVVVTMTVYQDNRGNFYYNHGLFDGDEKTSTPIRELEPDKRELRYTASAEVLDNNISQNDENVNGNNLTLNAQFPAWPGASPIRELGDPPSAEDVDDNLPDESDNLKIRKIDTKNRNRQRRRPRRRGRLFFGGGNRKSVGECIVYFRYIPYANEICSSSAKFFSTNFCIVSQKASAFCRSFWVSDAKIFARRGSIGDWGKNGCATNM